MSTPPRRPRVLFRVLAGPRAGFGHLLRATALAEALGVTPRISIRGGLAAADVARGLGAVVVEGSRATAVLATERPDAIVIDDREASATTPWRRAARRFRVSIVSIHDLGLGLGDADLVVDGSFLQRGRERSGSVHLRGPRYAILRSVPSTTRRPARTNTPRVVVTLGGGSRVRLASDVASRIVALVPDARVSVAAGFAGRGRQTTHEWIPTAELADALGQADVAVVAGGVTLYEALAGGVPVVASAIVASQRPTIAAAARQGACLDGGRLSGSRDAARIAQCVSSLLADVDARRRLSRTSRALVDDRGAVRVARAIHALLAARARATEAAQ